MGDDLREQLLSQLRESAKSRASNAYGAPEGPASTRSGPGSSRVVLLPHQQGADPQALSRMEAQLQELGHSLRVAEQTIAKLQHEVSAERTARQETEAVLEDTTKVLSDLRAQQARSAVAGASGLAAGAAEHEPEAVALLRAQLLRAEAEIAALRRQAPPGSPLASGTCQRCADLQLAIALSPSFRPRPTEPPARPAAGPPPAAAPPSTRALPAEASGPGPSPDVVLSANASGAWLGFVAVWGPAAYLWVSAVGVVLSLPFLAAFCATAMPVAPTMTSQLRRAARAGAYVYAALATCGAALYFCTCSNLGMAALAAYAVWASRVDRAPELGSRAFPSLRHLAIWKDLARHYLVAMFRTVELDPSGAYIACVYPQRTLRPAPFLALGTDALSFSRVFPALDVRILGYSSNLSVPFVREVLMAMGFGVDTDSGVMGVLSRGPGSMAVVTGDEAPVLGDAKGGRDHPTLDDSAGARAIRRFARLAMQSGASLVPVFVFHDPPPGGGKWAEPLPPRFIASLEHTTGVQLPCVAGGLAHLRQAVASLLGESTPAGVRLFAHALKRPPPARVILGRPVACPKVADPSAVERHVEECAVKYAQELWRLIDENRRSPAATNNSGPNSSAAPTSGGL